MTLNVFYHIITLRYRQKTLRFLVLHDIIGILISMTFFGYKNDAAIKCQFLSKINENGVKIIPYLEQKYRLFIKKVALSRQKYAFTSHLVKN